MDTQVAGGGFQYQDVQGVHGRLTAKLSMMDSYGVRGIPCRSYILRQCCDVEVVRVTLVSKDMKKRVTKIRTSTWKLKEEKGELGAP